MPVTPDLSELRDAIQRHAWLEAFDALRPALEQVPPAAGVALATAHMTECLPIFETYRPKVAWPRAALHHLATGEPLPDDFDFSPEVEGINPIIVKFLDGLDWLDAAAADQHKPAICAAEAAKAILCAITVRRFEQFAKTFPKDWRIVLLREAGEEGLPSLKSKYLDELIVEEYAETLWHAVLVALEATPG
jgi:hypothetical protein